jgi:hypothetical protein
MIQKKGLERNTIDKFYTKKEITDICFTAILDNLIIDKKNDLIIEPSAGNGSFIEIIKKLCDNYKFFDIEPENIEIIKHDFLKIDCSKFNNKKIHIIGNPPFGRQSSSAIKFIKYASVFADSISFILPKSFKKISLKNKFSEYFHCIYETDLVCNSFLVNNKDHNVPCIFQIWKKEKFKRNGCIKIIPNNYKFVKKNENPDISFRRVGSNAGNIDINSALKNIHTHYFIKFDTFTTNFKDKLKILEFINKNDTVGPNSISKQELIKELNKIT